MIGRNLLKEAEDAAVMLHAATKKRARPPVEPPLARHYDQGGPLAKAGVLQMVHEAVHGEFDRVMCVEVADDFCDKVVGDGDPSMVGMLQLVSGAYYDTQIEFNGRSIWKSIQIPAGHSLHMLWFC